MLRKSFCLFALLIVGVAFAPKHAHAQTYTESVLYNFCSQTNCVDGIETEGLIQGADGNFYGIADEGGNDSYDCADRGCGTVFKLTPSGTLTTLYSFCSLANCADGEGPGSLMQGGDGNFYGTTSRGGSNYSGDNLGGTVFKLTSAGKFTTLYSFCNLASCADGSYPLGTLVQGTDGNFYGTTQSGGANIGSGYYGDGGGTVFKLTPAGKLTTLYSFCSLGGSNCTDGYNVSGSLVQGTDGNFYGTTAYGGANVGSGQFGIGAGTVFNLTPSGTLTTLYSFCRYADCPDGESASVLVQGDDGNFYGTTSNGGNFTCDDGNTGCGTAFKVTPSGTVTTLYVFCSLANCADGIGSLSGVVEGSDGNFYGTTLGGGITNTDCPAGCGTVFNISRSGTLTTLYTFCSVDNCADGDGPENAPVQGSDGNFYSTVPTGGANLSGCNAGFGCGTAYKIAVSPALAAPVQVTLSESSVLTGTPVTLTWKVLNAHSTTMQQCYAFVQMGGGAWSGLKTGSLAGGIYSGSASVTPTAEGIYTYALTCGGLETGFATLAVPGPNGSIVLATNSPVYVGTTVTLDATVYAVGATPTGSVTFTLGSTTLGSVPLANGIADLSLETGSIPMGSYVVTATYSGDSQLPSSKTMATIVIEGFPTETFLDVSPDPAIEGHSLTLTGSVLRTTSEVVPTGKVTFTSETTTLGTANLNNGTATLSLTVPASISPGTYPVVATYSGDATDAASTSGANLIVQAATNTALSVSPTTVANEKPVTFTSKVSRVGTTGTPTGTVDFYDGTLLLGSGTLNKGVATLTLTNNGTSLPAGVYGVTADYAGDALDITSQSPAVTITVNAAGATTQTTLSASSQIVGQTQQVTLSITVDRVNQTGTPTGTVSIYSGSTKIGIINLTNGVAEFTIPTSGLAPGVYPLTAQYSGDANDDPSTSSAVDITVIATTATTLVISPNPVPVDHTVSLAATVKQSPGTAHPTGTVTFTVGGTSVGPPQTLSNGTATLNLTDFGIAAGTYPVVASYSGDANDLASSATVNVVIQ